MHLVPAAVQFWKPLSELGEEYACVFLFNYYYKAILRVRAILFFFLYFAPGLYASYLPVLSHHCHVNTCLCSLSLSPQTTYKTLFLVAIAMQYKPPVTSQFDQVTMVSDTCMEQSKVLSPWF